MSILVVGSMAFDSVETPAGKREKALGGSANYFSISASYYTDVKLVAVVGQDFPQEHIQFLSSRGIDTSGLQVVNGDTFHWAGHYMNDLNEAETTATYLNVFADFDPTLPESYQEVNTVFLANIDPELQLKVLEQVKNPKLVAMDSMNFWIHSKKDALLNVLKKVNMVFVNDKEAELLSGEKNVVRAAKKIQQMGPSTVVIKRGEYGALLFSGDDMAFTPAMPLEDVIDPTGAGDTFAGGFLGLADREGEDFKGQVDGDLIRRCLITGTTMSSYVVQGFSFDKTKELNANLILNRWSAIKALSDVKDDLRISG